MSVFGPSPEAAAVLEGIAIFCRHLPYIVILGAVCWFMSRT